MKLWKYYLAQAWLGLLDVLLVMLGIVCVGLLIFLITIDEVTRFIAISVLASTSLAVAWHYLKKFTIWCEIVIKKED